MVSEIRFLGYTHTAVMLICLAWAPVADAGDTRSLSLFSQGQAGLAFPSGWKALTFKKIPQQTQYSLVQDGQTLVAKAQARGSASGMIHPLQLDPRQYPILQWRWKVDNVLEKGDVRKKSGDDYPARIYITFAYDPSRASFLDKTKYAAAKLLYGEYPPGAAMNYIWESKAAIGSVFPNPYAEQVKMLVLQSGSARLKQWIHEERNVYQDYQRLFGREPPMITGVAIMTDTDNTQESATAYYGDIVFKKAP